MNDMDYEEIAIVKWQHLKAKCRSLKIPFDLTVQDIKKLQSQVRCEVTGVLLSAGVGGVQTANTHTLDRIIPSKGYTNGNVVVMSKQVNSRKGDLSLKEILQLSQFVKKVLKMPKATDKQVLNYIKKVGN